MSLAEGARQGPVASHGSTVPAGSGISVTVE